MNIYFITFCITAITVLVIDIFKFWDNFSSEIIYYLTKGKIRKSIDLKPFNCSLCLSHWVNLIVLIATGFFTIPNYLYIILLSFFTGILGAIFLLVENIVYKLINKLNELL